MSKLDIILALNGIHVNRFLRSIPQKTVIPAFFRSMEPCSESAVRP